MYNKLMSFPYMGFSLHNDFGKKLTDETGETTRNRGGMDVRCNETEFWPIEHPTEPLDEDRPVKCPIPDSSSVINEQNSDSLRKRAEIRTRNKETNMALPSIRAVRKRHHGVDHAIMSPMLRMPPLYSLPSQNMTIFHMLQQFNKFES